MKKNLWILVFLLLVVGCKKTNLACTKRIIDTEDVKVDERISLDFKNKKLDKSFFSLDYYYATNIEANSSVAKESLEEQFGSYKDKKGIEYLFSDIDQGLHFELQITPSKIEEEWKKDFEKQINYKDYSDAKEILTKDGYQCK